MENSLYLKKYIKCGGCKGTGDMVTGNLLGECYYCKGNKHTPVFVKENPLTLNNYKKVISCLRDSLEAIHDGLKDTNTLPVVVESIERTLKSAEEALRDE